MRRCLGAAAAALLLAGCALQPPHPDTFSFGVIGDLPYTASEEDAFDRLIDAMNDEPLAFAVHIGDIKSGSSSCTDALYADRKRRLERSRHPMAFTPGDNDWVDCRRVAAGRWNPLERLEKVREVFFASRDFLGTHTGAMLPDVMLGCARFEGSECVCHALPENRRWRRTLPTLGRDVVFVTINVQGSDDNRGFDSASDRESECRASANRLWLQQAFAGPSRLAAVVVIFHANPLVHSRLDAYDALVAQIKALTKAFSGPVLIVHGDTHRYRADRPFLDENGRVIANLQRLETFGSPFIGWVRVTVDPNDERFFRFEPRGAE